MGKPILCLDFDGVIHSYESGWKGADVIPDPPVDGFFEFLEEVCPNFDVQIFSSRSHQDGGVEAMMAWLIEHRRLWREGTESGKNAKEIIDISFPTEKPAAMVSIDDRALTFTGSWPSTQQLLNFKPWNKS